MGLPSAVSPSGQSLATSATETGWIRALLLVALVLLFTAKAEAQNGAAVAAALEDVVTTAIQKAEPAIVSIARVKATQTLIRPEPFNPFEENRRPRRRSDDDLSDPTSPDFIPNEFGAGVVIERSGRRVVLTNYHVVRGGPVAGEDDRPSEYRLFVRLYGGRGYEASIIAADPRSDLAVLDLDVEKLQPKAEEIKSLPLAEKTDFKKGRFVITLGNPYAVSRDGSASAGWGMISNIARRPAPLGPRDDPDTMLNETIHHAGTLLQIDARLNLGSSGGAVLNLDGELIGVTTSLAAIEGYEKSSGFAVPIDKATRRIIDDLCRGLEVEYGFLGVEPRNLTPENARTLGPDFPQASAAMLVRVYPNSPADRGGLRPGDVVLSIEGNPVYDRFDLIRHTGRLSPGATARVRVWRNDGASKDLNVSLGKWPVYDDEGLVVTAKRRPAWRGLTIDYPTARRRYVSLPFKYHKAVVVTEINAKELPRLPLNQEIRLGNFITHVNGTAVSTPEEFYAAVKKLSGVVELRLLTGERIRLPE